MRYNGTVYRPPIEGTTLLVPATEGCTHNACTFCNMYRDVRFRPVPEDAIREHLEEMRAAYRTAAPKVERAFLVGADPFALPRIRIEALLDLIHEYFPGVKTLTMYAAVRNIKRKSDEDLRLLKELGVDDLYVGIESGLEDVLAFQNKGNTVAEAREQCLRLNRFGIGHRSMLMFGVAGAGRGLENAQATAQLLNEIKPNAVLPTTLGGYEKTKLAEEVAAGRFVPATELENLREEIALLEALDIPGCYYWGGHAVNYAKVSGYLDEDKEEMICEIGECIAEIEKLDANCRFVREPI